MHELALAQDVFNQILAAAQEKKIPKISSARVKIGAARISHPAEFEELFYAFTKGTAAEGIKLEFEITPLKTICSNCGQDFNPPAMRLDCPHCHSTKIKVIAGNDLMVEAVS